MFEKFKERETAWRSAVIAASRPHLRAGEDPKVLAIAQTLPSWPFFLLVGAGAAALNGALLGDDNYLPAWVGFVGIAVALAGVMATTYFPRRAVIRTQDRVYVFRLDRDRDNPGLEQERTVEGERLPVLWDGGIHADGKALHAWNSQRREKELLRAAFAEDPENP